MKCPTGLRRCRRARRSGWSRRALKSAVFCCAILSFTAYGQAGFSSTATRDATGVVEYTTRVSFDPKPFENPPVTGAPYSADEYRREKNERSLNRRIFRDGQGRERVERRELIGAGASVQVIEIMDSVAG